MTTLFGRNLKLSVDRALQSNVRRFYEEGFGCERRTPNDKLDQFIFGAGESLGVFYVDAVQALPESSWEHAPWLEFIVDEDPKAVATRLLALGGTLVEYTDKSHTYLRAPGGPVFRLAPKAK